MKVHRKFEDIDYNKNSVITVGTFDGVHLGHQFIINRINKDAEEIGARTVLLTIHPHPRLVVKSEDNKKVKLLTTIEERLHLFEKFGLQNIMIIPFSYEFSRTKPEDFVRNYLNKIGFSKIFIGYDHMFGRDRSGNEDLLKRLSEELDFEIEKISALDLDGMNISSTKIRNAVENHDIDTANKMLGYNFLVSGNVMKGDGRGRQIGYPTANIELPEHKILPAIGVYLVRSEIKGKMFYGMANIGLRPTFTSGNELTLEIFFFDFEGDIYNEFLNVEFLRFIRTEQKFEGLDSFLEQLKKDKKKSEELIKSFYN